MIRTFDGLKIDHFSSIRGRNSCDTAVDFKDNCVNLLTQKYIQIHLQNVANYEFVSGVYENIKLNCERSFDAISIAICVIRGVSITRLPQQIFDIELNFRNRISGEKFKVIYRVCAIAIATFRRILSGKYRNEQYKQFHNLYLKVTANISSSSPEEQPAVPEDLVPLWPTPTTKGLVKEKNATSQLTGGNSGAHPLKQ